MTRALQETKQQLQQHRVLLIRLNDIASIRHDLAKRPQGCMLQLNVVKVLHAFDEKRHNSVKVLDSLGATLRRQLSHHRHNAAGEGHVMSVLAHLAVQAVEKRLHVQVDEAGRVREQVAHQADAFLPLADVRIDVDLGEELHEDLADEGQDVGGVGGGQA